MTQITISFDPREPDDVAEAQHLIEQLANGSDRRPADDPEALRERVISLVQGYGEGRTEYLRLIAQASPARATYQEIRKLFDNPKGIGGTHGSIEKSWRRMGGRGKFIDTDHNGDSLMEPYLAELVLELLPPTDN